MRTTTIAMSSVGLLAMASVCEADTTATLKVSARVIRDCTVIADGVTNCSPETLRVQSNYSGRVTVKTVNGNPSVSFVGVQPSVEQDENTLNISF